MSEASATDAFLAACEAVGANLAFWRLFSLGSPAREFAALFLSRAVGTNDNNKLREQQSGKA